MSFKRYKPFFKQFLKIKKNVQNQYKLLKFKKYKWVKFQQHLKIQLKFFRRFKIKDQSQILILKFASRGNSFKKKFKNNLQFRKTFSLFYGKLKKKYIKFQFLKLINYSFLKKTNHKFIILKFFESRLDVILYRSGFSLSIKGSTQLIVNNHVLVNGTVVKIKSYIVKPTDCIGIAFSEKSRKLVKNNLNKSNFWTIPPKHLVVNFKTLQIFFNYTIFMDKIPIFNHYLNISSVISNIKKG